ncbi:MAG: tyrosine-type recombinase/integrase [Cytophagales bacterium]|nr:tyrosine-type recombinase/integrase [Cytophagales bacterium]
MLEIRKIHHRATYSNKFSTCIKFYYEKVSKQPKLFFDLPRPKRKKILPKVIDQQDVKKILSAFKSHHPKDYLFEGQFGGAISIRTAQQLFANAKRKAGIHKSVGIHSLRHSFATHLHEQGIDIKHIQDLLGHTNIATTMRYTHVSKKDLGKIKSPLDNI